MLGLKLPTDPRWVNLAEMSIADILTDHAYCEQKAASTAISIVQAYPEYSQVVDALIPIVTEEWGHFKMVVDILRARELPLGRQRRDVYVNTLALFVRKGGHRAEALTDRLLFSALIEARSCERFKLLSLGLTDPELQEFYRRLMVSEAGHYRLFLDLAYSISGRAMVDSRWQEWLVHEAGILASIEVRGDRVH